MSRQRGRGRLQRIVCVPDTHVPLHNKRSLSCVRRVIAALKPERLVFLGDFIDAESMTRHTRGPERERFLRREIDVANVELDKFSALRVPQVDFLLGNHCAHIERYISERAPELFGLVDVATLLRFRERGWRWHAYRNYLKIGKIGLTHDLGYAGANATAQSLAAFGSSIVIGHTHRAAVVYGGDTRGNRHVAISSGWLGDETKLPPYMHRSAAQREWQQAFTLITMRPDGVGWCQLVPIIDGECIVEGRRFRG